MTGQPEPVRYRKPALRELPRGIVPLASAGLLQTGIHVLAPGARQGLHAHEGHDQFYFVLSGTVRFLGEGAGLPTELGPREGILIPRGTPYGFEPVGRDAELMFTIVAVPGAEDRFVSHEPGSDEYRFELYAPDGSPLDMKAV